MKNRFEWDEWFERASSVRTIKDFNEFYKYLFEGEIEFTYDSAVHATSALALAGAWLGAHKEGITGFQAGYVKFDFIRQWDREGKEVGLHVVDYDRLCYPQFLRYFPLKYVDLKIWKQVQSACKKKLEELDIKGGACFKVREYWGNVCKGIIPVEISVREELDNGSYNFIHAIDPIPVIRPSHTIGDKERDYSDHTSPWYDRERVLKEIENPKVSSNEC